MTQGLSWLLIISYVVLWVLVVVLAVGFAALARQIGILHRRNPGSGARMQTIGVQPGEPMTPFTLTDVYRRPLDIPSQERAHSLLVLFTLTCPVCEQIVAAAESLSYSERHVAVALLGMASDDRLRSYVAERRVKNVAVAGLGDLHVRLGVRIFPYALVLDKTGVVVSHGLVNNREQMDSLLEAAQTSDHATDVPIRVEVASAAQA